MKTSESLKHFAPALRKAQSEMEAVKKDQSNPFFKSKYANIESIIDCVTPILGKNFLSFSQHPVSTERGVGVTTILMHDSGEWIQESYTLPIASPKPQEGAAAITYARRYGLQSICGLRAYDDDDGEKAMGR
jgi:hypothetical protein